MTPTSKAYLQLHIAVLLFGLTAILGDLIQLSAIEIVWWRVLLTCLSIMIFFNLKKRIKLLDRMDILRFMGIGVIVGIHWICFYGAIKFSNASIALICLSTTSFFTSIIEPILTGSSFKKKDFIFGLLIIPGMMLIVNNIDSSFQIGMLIGVMSALAAAVFSSLNKRLIDRTDAYTMTFLELGGSWIFVSLLFPFLLFGEHNFSFWPNQQDWIYMIILSLACTTWAFSLSLKALEHLSAFISNLVINLEPVYGIIMAAVILKEYDELNLQVYIGVLMILAVVLSYPLINRKKKKSLT